MAETPADDSDAFWDAVLNYKPNKHFTWETIGRLVLIIYSIICGPNSHRITLVYSTDLFIHVLVVPGLDISTCLPPANGGEFSWWAGKV